MGAYYAGAEAVPRCFQGNPAGQPTMLNGLPGTGTIQRLETGLLLRAYAAGLFPMADTREADDVFWVEPRRRGIIPLDNFHLPRSLARVLKQERFIHTRDIAFDTVIEACASAAPGRQQSWINNSIIDGYCRLHREGHAHSIETWDQEGRLVGGLYGVRLGAAFFGESMFSRATDASKTALAHLVARLKVGGFDLLDTQFLTAHLARFGGLEVRRTRYLGLLDSAVGGTAQWNQLDHVEGLSLQPSPAPLVSGDAGVAGSTTGAGVGAGFLARVAPDELGGFGPSGTRIVQLLSQTS